jgi:hypothetical protein
MVRARTFVTRLALSVLLLLLIAVTVLLISLVRGVTVSHDGSREEQAPPSPANELSQVLNPSLMLFH